nr:hypothetical protein CFP56_15113 [Quercus suber]
MDLATALGRAHNVISDERLKPLSSVPSHELVSHHVHKLVHVVMANSRVEAAKVESSRLMKDLIEAMDYANEAEAKMKEVLNS